MKIVSVEKKLADKLVEECTETVEELKIVSENKKKCSSCVLYIVIEKHWYLQHWIYCN